MSLEKVEKIPSSDTSGVLSFPIEGPLRDERYRLTVGMTDADRAYRKQWLQDQILAESEPIEVPGYYEARYNPIRRFYRYPLDKIFARLQPVIGEEQSIIWRTISGKLAMGFAFAFATFYYFQYNSYSWTSHSGWKFYQSKKRILPGDPAYGHPTYLANNDFADFGFKKSPI